MSMEESNNLAGRFERAECERVRKRAEQQDIVAKEARLAAWEVFMSSLNAAFEAGKTYLLLTHGDPLNVANFLLRAWVQWQLSYSEYVEIYDRKINIIGAGADPLRYVDEWVRKVARPMLGVGKFSMGSEPERMDQYAGPP